MTTMHSTTDFALSLIFMRLTSDQLVPLFRFIDIVHEWIHGQEEQQTPTGGGSKFKSEFECANGMLIIATEIPEWTPPRDNPKFLSCAGFIP